MNKFKLYVSLVFTLLTFFFAPLTFAGGGGVDTRVTNTDDPHAITVIVHFDPKLFTCKGMNVSFNFEIPEDGDMIQGTNGDNTSTILEEAWMAKTRLRCFTYAKVYSKELKLNRTLNISFNGANLEGSRKIAVSFGVNYNPNDLPLLAWENPSDPAPVATPPTKPNYTSEPNKPTFTSQPIVTPEPKKVDQPQVTDNENNNEELNRKIANLEEQIEESKREQNILTQRINDLVSFIKKLFPFFN